MPSLRKQNQLKMQHPLRAGLRDDDEEYYIYKDFDTSLTKVHNHLRELPSIDQTTSKRNRDIIRERIIKM